jgi:hypothetical protein
MGRGGEGGLLTSRQVGSGMNAAPGQYAQWACKRAPSPIPGAPSRMRVGMKQRGTHARDMCLQRRRPDGPAAPAPHLGTSNFPQMLGCVGRQLPAIARRAANALSLQGLLERDAKGRTAALVAAEWDRCAVLEGLHLRARDLDASQPQTQRRLGSCGGSCLRAPMASPRRCPLRASVGLSRPPRGW